MNNTQYAYDQQKNTEKYTYAGVINFLNRELRSFENERDTWALEKSQLLV